MSRSFLVRVLPRCVEVPFKTHERAFPLGNIPPNIGAIEAFGVPYYNYSILGPNPIPIIKAPKVGSPIRGVL